MTTLAPVNKSSRNQQTYQRLRQVLSMSLRRQVFIAVCDNLSLRDGLAKELESDLSLNLVSKQSNGSIYPQLVTLELNLDNSNFLSQIAQWLKQQSLNSCPSQFISFQIIGIERLTRQPAARQRHFLRTLKLITPYLSQLEFNLLLWLSRPWLYTIEQSVPEFWRWHTGIFEFQGEPTPIATNNFPQPEIFSSSTSIKEKFLQTILRENNNDFEENNQEQDSIFPEQESEIHQFTTDNLEDSEQLQQQYYSPESTATVLIKLANQYRDHITQGDVSEANLTRAIQTYEQALQLLEDNYPGSADIFNDLGNLYWLLSRYTYIANQAVPILGKAIQCYQLALVKLTDQTNPQTYAMIQNNLGAMYSDLARYQDTQENLELSIRAYEDALCYYSPQDDPLKYGSTQNNLGTAYWNLAQKQSSITNLKLAIASYQQALAQYNPEEHSLNWAMIQNNIGTAYWNLAQHEKPETWLQCAISCYQQALKYRTPEIAPAACAATHNNLGTVYWDLSANFTTELQQWQELLQQAIAAYEIALDLAQQLNKYQPSISINFDVPITLNNLGLVHYQIATTSEFSLKQEVKSIHLKASLEAHLYSLQKETPETPNYQTTLNYIINTVRAYYQEEGIAGQNLALSQIPSHLLPKILAYL